MFKASEVLSKQHQAEDLKSLQQAITDNYIVDEDEYMRELLPLVPADDDTVSAVTERAAKLVEQVRAVSYTHLTLPTIYSV